MMGETLGPYEILEKLGAGGMGEVYRARDSKLNRDVALKVLPQSFAGDPARMARFEREAQVLASLNHPNIAAVHGLEDAAGTLALVMELVEGSTLAERIARGPLPLDEALPIARQIADALEEAHERGIVHRDLKPANVKITPDGKVKVLDFGLAKALAEDALASDTRQSPTLSLAMTQAGIILGTAGYMSPEQARGRPVDRRADIWAFGCVLYEMLSGRQLFSGEDVAVTLAAVVRDTPNLGSLPGAVPPPIRALLERCLEKDPKARLRDIGEARLAIERCLANPEAAPAAADAAPTPPWRGSKLGWIAAAAALLAAAAASAGWWRASRPAEQPLLWVDLDLGRDVALSSDYPPSAIVSPDGIRIAFSGRGSDGRFRLYVRLLSQPQATPLAGTEGAQMPFFSPDGQWLGFFADDKLKKVPVHGGGAGVVCNAPTARGGSWGEDGRIVTGGSASGLSRVSSAGGAPEALTSLDPTSPEFTHRWPQALRGAVLFTVQGRSGDNESSSVEIVSLGTGRRKVLVRGGTYGRYLPSGHLAYVERGSLFVAPMDLDRLDLLGPAVPVLEGIAASPSSGGAQFAFSDSGMFLFVSGKSHVSRTVAWLDASGRTRPLLARSGDYSNPRLSPDGKRLALTVAESGNYDVWIYEWERDTMSRLTFTQSMDAYPVWTPDGKQLAFRSGSNIYWVRSDGAGEAKQLTSGGALQAPSSFSPDGRRLAYHELAGSSRWDIWTLALERGDSEDLRAGKPEPFLRSPANELNPAFSPDASFLAYSSDESGTLEIYVRPFPGPGGKWQVSSGGGAMPVWSRTGREIFYRTSDQRIMVVGYTSRGGAFEPEKPRLWSQTAFAPCFPSYLSNFDLSPDGRRFAVLLAPDGSDSAGTTRLMLLVHFFDELRRRAPASR